MKPWRYQVLKTWRYQELDGHWYQAVRRMTVPGTQKLTKN